jgi:outer membrane lipoprotein-sorting protein
MAAGALASAEVAPALDGEVGLRLLAESRASITAVAGEGTQTITRVGEADFSSEEKRVRFVIALDGRYEIVLTDPADPNGERTRVVSDGTTAWEQSWASVEDQPIDKPLAGGGNDLLRRLLACLRMDVAALGTEYTLQLLPSGQGVRELRLTPTAEDLKREILTISVFVNDAGSPMLVVLAEVSGNRRRLALSAFIDNPQIDPDHFRVPARKADPEPH